MNMVTSSKGKPLMPTLDDTDLACLVALQAEPARPGASWGGHGHRRAHGGPAPEAPDGRGRAARHRRADPLVTGRGVVLHAWVRCRSGRVPDVAERLAALDSCQLAVTLAGSADLMAELTLADEADMPDLVTRVLPSIDGVEHVEARLVLRPFRRAGQWRILAEAGAALEPAPSNPPAALTESSSAWPAI